MWSRPAVSTSTASVPRLRAARSASVSTAEGSAPEAPRWKAAPAREAQTSSCSAAAARKVSAAQRRTDRPSPVQPAASLPMVVVLPAPLTPTTKTHPRPGREGRGPGRALEGAPDLGAEHLAHRGEGRRPRSPRCGPAAPPWPPPPPGGRGRRRCSASSTESRLSASSGRRPRTRSSTGVVRTSRVRRSPPRRRSRSAHLELLVEALASLLGSGGPRRRGPRAARARRPGSSRP